jgi:hypothetical protein
VLATFAVGLAALAAGVAVTLARADVRPLSTNDVIVQVPVSNLDGDHRVCQDGERIPAGTAAVMATIVPSARRRAAMSVEIATGGATVASGTASRWQDNAAVVTLRRVVAADVAGRVCLEIRTRGEEVTLVGASAGEGTDAVADGERLGGRVRFEYLRSGEETWWAFAPTIVERIGRGHAWSGSSVALAAALLTLTSILLAGWQLARVSR